MERESTTLMAYRWSLFVNVAQIAACCLPVLLHLARLFDYSTNFVLSAALVVAISVVTAYIWTRVMEQTGVLLQDVPSLKPKGIRLAREICFSRLWVIPSRDPMSISDTAWQIAMKSHGNSVCGALSAATTPGYFPVGFLCLAGFYMGFLGEYGITLDRVARAFNVSSAIQLFLISLSGVICTALLFNGFFQYFISRGKK